MEPILILTTGGTIDKIYFDAKSAYEVGPPNISKLLAELNLAIEYRIVSLMRKDSLELSDVDRQLICDQVSQAPERQVLITHGTDTMVETAEKLRSVADKTIVLTGAMEPALFKTSDATFNIGCGLTAVQTLAAGVYIAMNGRVFKAGNVRKNVQANRFETINSIP
jgi:L-asparaginase